MAASTQTTIPAAMTNLAPNPPELDLPATLDAAVDRVLALLEPADRTRIAALAESGAASLNGLRFGAEVRKACGLWRGNPALMVALGALNPEEASEAVILAVRARLRGG
jgi:hypothetical protein